MCRRILAPHLIGLALAFAACGDDGGTKSLAPDVSADVADTGTPPDGTAPPPDTSTPGPDLVDPGPNALAYGPGLLGSDGTPCATSCAMRRLAGEEIELAVVYKNGQGQPLQDVQITWDAGDAPTDLARLTALSSYTDPNGLARVTVRSGGLTGSATITARVLGDTASLTFVITYDAPAEPDLAASFEYVGQASFVGFELRLFEQRDGTPSCASVHPDAGASIAPTLTLGPLEAGTQARVATLPGLATAGTQRWVVQFVGPWPDPANPAASRVPLAVGCVDGVVATAGQTATALVYVLDLPKHFRGVYQTVTRLDSLSGGEGTAIGDVLVTLSELFTRPGRLLVTWACGDDPGGTLGTVCSWVTNNQGEPNVLGGIITDAADAALLALFEAAVGPEIQDASQLISEILRDLRLVAVTTFASEPATPKQGFSGALFAPGDADEEWTHVRFRWKFDPLCKNSATPDDCGWTSIPLEQVYGQRPTSNLEAGVDTNLALHVTPHTVSRLTYGPLVNAIIEKRVLPLVFAAGGDEPLDSWDDFVATLFGDRLCLDYGDCCDYFAQRLEDTTLGSLVSFETRVLACEVAIPLVAGLIRRQLTDLDGALHLGTYADRPCPAIDGDQDRWVDAYGAIATPCAWDLHFPIGGSQFRPDNDWRSIAQ